MQKLLVLMMIGILCFSTLIPTLAVDIPPANPMTPGGPQNPTVDPILWLGGGQATGDTLAWNPEWLKLETKTPIHSQTTIIVQGEDVYHQKVEAKVVIPAGTSSSRYFLLNDTHSTPPWPVTFAKITGIFQQNGTHCNAVEILTHNNSLQQYIGRYTTILGFQTGVGPIPWGSQRYLVATGPHTYPDYQGGGYIPTPHPVATYQNVPVEPVNAEPLKIAVNWIDNDYDAQIDPGEPHGVSDPNVVVWIEGLDENGNPLIIGTTITDTINEVNAGNHTWSTVDNVWGGGQDEYYIFTHPAPERALFKYFIRINHVSIEPLCYDILANPDEVSGAYPGVTNITVALRDADGYLVNAPVNIVMDPRYPPYATRIRNVTVNFMTSGGKIQPSYEVQIPPCHITATVNLTADTNARTIKVTATANVPPCISDSVESEPLNLFAWTELTFDGINSVQTKATVNVHSLEWGWQTWNWNGTTMYANYTGPIPPTPRLSPELGGPDPSGPIIDGPIYAVMIPLLAGRNLISCPVHPILGATYYCEAFGGSGIPMDLLFGMTSTQDAIEEIRWYNAETGTWDHYVPGVTSVPSGKYFLDGVDYWIKARRNCILMISGVSVIRDTAVLSCHPLMSPWTPEPMSIDWIDPGGVDAHSSLVWNPESLKLQTQTLVHSNTTVFLQGLDTYGQNIEAKVVLPEGTMPQLMFVFYDNPCTGKPVAFSKITDIFEQNGTAGDSFEILTHNSSVQQYMGRYTTISGFEAGVGGPASWPYPQRYLVATGPHTYPDWQGGGYLPPPHPVATYQNVPVEPVNPELLKIATNWIDNDHDAQIDPGELHGVSDPNVVVWIEGLDENGNPLIVSTTITDTVNVVNAGNHTWSTVCTVWGGGSDEYYIFTEPVNQRALFECCVAAEHAVYIRADGSIDPSTAPISSIDNVTYTLTADVNESIVVERDNTVINGAGHTVQGQGRNQAGIYLYHRSNVTLEDTEIKAFDYGVYCYCCSNNTILGNNITASTYYGICLDSSIDNHISGNNIAANDYGINLFCSPHNMLKSNMLSNNVYGLSVRGSSLPEFVQDIDLSNMVNGKPVYYWMFETDKAVPLDAGYVALVGCRGITVQNLTLSENGEGILLANTTDTTIAKNNIANNGYGVYLDLFSNGNSIFHNNFVNNTEQVYASQSYYNVWDDGYPSGGNYWSDYIGVDLYSGPYQNETGSDSIGDSPYVIDANNMDLYPLMPPHSMPTVSVDPSTTSIFVGQSFNVSVQVHDVSDLYLWVFSIRWNPATMEFTSISEGEFLKRGGSTTGVLVKSVNQTGGCLEEAACSLLGNVPGVDGDGVLATITFRAIGLGSSPVSIAFHDLIDSNGSSIQSDSVDGTVNVTAPDLSIVEISLPYPTLAKYVNTTIPINVTIQNTGTADADAFNVSFTAYWNSGGLLEHYEEQRVAHLDVNTTTVLDFHFAPRNIGNYTLTFRVDCNDEIVESNETNNEPSLPIVVYAQGDITGDGQVTYRDLFMLARAYWSAPSDPNWDARADMNYDGMVDYKDLFLLSKNYS